MRIDAGWLVLAALAAGCSRGAPEPRAGRPAATADKLRGYSQRAVLDKLGGNSRNGFCFRCDDRLATARISYDPATGVAGRSALPAFEFEGADEPALAHRGLEAGVEGGRLGFVSAGHGYLVTEGDLDLPRDLLAEVEIRMKTALGKELRLGWSTQTGKAWVDEELGVTAVPLESEEGFHVYRIALDKVLKTRAGAEDRIRTLFFAPANRCGDRVEIDYIRLLDGRERYRRRAVGSGRVAAGGVSRPAIWTPAAASLAWDLRLPEEECSFRGAAGFLFGGEAAAEFRVLVDGETVRSLRVEGGGGWTEIPPLSLGRWRGKTVTLALETSGDAPGVAVWANPAVAAAPRSRFNVVIFLEDALRADRLGCYGYGTPTSPRKSELLAGGGVVFASAVSQATMTRPSCPSLMTSLYPNATGVLTFRDRLPPEYLTLAEIMREQGFATGAFVQNVAAGTAAGLDQGYCEFYDSERVFSRPRDLFGAALESWLDRHADSNFFLYLHLLDPHGPYNPPPPFDAAWREYTGPRTPVAGNRPGLVLDPPGVVAPSREGRNLRYDGEVADNDYWFGVFTEMLKTRGLWNDTLIVCLADHGEFLGERGRWGHHPPGLAPVIHVPLLFFYPARWREKIEVETPVQLLDVMPTVLELARVASAPLVMQGDSLLSLIDGDAAEKERWARRPAISEEVSGLGGRVPDDPLGSVVTGGRHYIFSRRLGAGDEERRTIRTLAWPGDAPAPGADGGGAARAESVLRDLARANRMIRESIRGGAPAKTEAVSRRDPETDRRLQALGYLQ